MQIAFVGFEGFDGIRMSVPGLFLLQGDEEIVYVLLFNGCDNG